MTNLPNGDPQKEAWQAKRASLLKITDDFLGPSFELPLFLKDDRQYFDDGQISEILDNLSELTRISARLGESQPQL